MEMVELKTADLIGPALDWAVAQAEDWRVVITQNFLIRHLDKHGNHYGWVEPSADWSQGGPLIDKYGIGVAKFYEPIDGPVICGMEWAAIWIDDSVRMDGPTALIAACRAIVSAKLGDTVSVPAELVWGDA